MLDAWLVPAEREVLPVECLQAALDAPTSHSLHFPNSFYPRDAHPTRLVVENRIGPEVRAALAARGHEVIENGPWVHGQVTAVEFDRRHKARGVRATAVHPGGIRTELSRHLTPEQQQALMDGINAANKAAGGPHFRFKTIPQGAATSVWAAVVAQADEVGGRYCENCHVGVLVPDDRKISAIGEGVRGYALDGERAKALWAKSEEWVGERF